MLELGVHAHCSGAQVREGVRTMEEAIRLAQSVKDCSVLQLRGIMTHHGRLEKFLPIVEAVRSNVSQVRGCVVHMNFCAESFKFGSECGIIHSCTGTWGIALINVTGAHRCNRDI